MILVLVLEFIMFELNIGKIIFGILGVNDYFLIIVLEGKF